MWIAICGYICTPLLHHKSISFLMKGVLLIITLANVSDSRSDSRLVRIPGHDAFHQATHRERVTCCFSSYLRRGYNSCLFHSLLFLLFCLKSCFPHEPIDRLVSLLLTIYTTPYLLLSLFSVVCLHIKVRRHIRRSHTTCGSPAILLW